MFQNNDVSMILTHIGEIIECLMTLIPSMRGGTALNLTVRTMSTNMESIDGFERYTGLIKTQFPGVDIMVSKRLVESLCWRWSRLGQFPESPNSKKDPMKRNSVIKLTKQRI